MTIGLFGNTCNNLFQIGKALRRYSNYDVRLFVDLASEPQQLPENDEPELAGRYPDWITAKRYSGPEKLLFPWLSPILRDLNQSDFIIVSGYGALFAQFLRKPYYFLATGGDLTVWPFPFRFHSLFSTFGKKAGQVLRALWQRRGLRRATEIWTQPFYPFVRAINDLGIPESRVSNRYFPIIINVESFHNGHEKYIQPTPSRWAQEMTSRFDFVLFHPSRLIIRDTEALRMTGTWKANDRLIRGFAEFVRKCPEARAGLVLIDRPNSLDAWIARDLIAALGIQESVLWLKPPRNLGFNREELIELYAASDVVGDDFGAGWFGSVVVEGLASCRPVISYVDEPAMSKLYPWHPLVSVREPEQIAASLKKLWQDKSYRYDLGVKGRQWAETYHSPAGGGRIYVDRIDEVYESLRRPKIAVTQLAMEDQ